MSKYVFDYDSHDREYEIYFRDHFGNMEYITSVNDVNVASALCDILNHMKGLINEKS